MGSQSLEKLIISTDMQNFANNHNLGVTRMYSGPIGPGIGAGSLYNAQTNNPLNPSYQPPSYNLEPLNQKHNYIQLKNNNTFSNHLPQIEPIIKPVTNITPMTTTPNSLFDLKGPGDVLKNRYDLNNNWSLQERFDFSRHNNLPPHLNYEFVNPSGSVQKKLNNYLDKNNHHNINLF
jgi:hypothetical protein